MIRDLKKNVIINIFIAAVEPHVGLEEVFIYTFGRKLITYNKSCR